MTTTTANPQTVNLNNLTQSQIQTLTLKSQIPPQNPDLISPTIDRSLFNESTGSRRQTYTRLHHNLHRSRLPSLKPHNHHRLSQTLSDPVTNSIVHYLKHFLSGNPNSPPPPPPPIPPESAELGFLGFGEKLKIGGKKKRGNGNYLTENRVLENGKNLGVEFKDLGVLGFGEKLKIGGKRKRESSGKYWSENRVLENGVGVEIGKVNGKGLDVDFEELGKNGDGWIGEVLKRKTEGLESEESVLGFLWGLEGYWCSRRRRRKYVDAGLFGDVLPVGWKLLLGIRRRDYRASVYCRRFISPTGKQFISCKEAASFLKSYFGGNDEDQQRNQKTCSIQQAYVLSSEKNVQPADRGRAIVVHSTYAKNPSNTNDNNDCLMDIENLPEVKVNDIFECSKCKLTFDEKNVYLQHLFSFHQKTTKRYRYGVGEGVIIKDGKYECQFCHKVFDEKRKYSGHVGIHVRNSGKNSKDLTVSVSVNKTVETPLEVALPSSSLKVGTLTDIAENSIVEKTSNIGTGKEAVTEQSVTVSKLEEVQEANLGSDTIEIRREDSYAERGLSEDLNHESEAMMENYDMVNNDDTWKLNLNMDVSCMDDLERDGSREIEEYEKTDLDMNFGNGCSNPSSDHLEDTPGLTLGEIDFHNGVSSVPLTQSFQFFPPFNSVSNKEEHEFSIVNQKLENVTGFEELRFDDIGPYGFMNGQELSSLPGSSLNLGNDHSGIVDGFGQELSSLPGSSLNLGNNHSGIVDGFNSSVRFGSEEVMLNTMDADQLTVCVWCRTEFKLEGIESEFPSDSIGYMCPTCKANISGHFSGGF